MSQKKSSSEVRVGQLVIYKCDISLDKYYADLT